MSRVSETFGDQWWVLDNALPLSRSLGEKKGRELLLLRELKTRYSGFPEGAVTGSESPDFMVETSNGRVVGIELVEVHRYAARRKGSPQRERQEAEEKVLRLAEDIYYARDCPLPVYAHLTWPPDSEGVRVGPLPIPSDEIAAEVARLVLEGAPVWVGGDKFELGPTQLEGTLVEGVLQSISARRTGFIDNRGRDSHWGKSFSYGPAEAGIADLTHAVSTKNRVYARCIERCDEVWLVATLTGGPASFEDADEAVFAHPFPSAFDRLILLCPGSRRTTYVANLVTLSTAL